MQSRFLARAQFQILIDTLIDQGYECLGPQVQDGSIVYKTLHNVAQLPHGIRDHQSPGSYRLQSQNSQRYFAWANGAQALKPLTFTPQETMWRVERKGEALQFHPAEIPPKKLAVIGVRACDLAALALQQIHFESAKDKLFTARREQLLLIAVDCSHPADTCFCASTGDGPNISRNADLALSELDDGFVIRADSEKGRSVLEKLPTQTTTDKQTSRVIQQTQQASAAQKRKLPSHNLEQALFKQQNNPHWQTFNERCLACGNCTAVCPSCFCVSYEANPSLNGETSEHQRLWDSCFNKSHSLVHGHPVRDSTHLRYRQWLTHKLAGWHAQFGRSGCVGCGRCITWCPVGIDITQEVSTLLAGEAK